MSPWIYLLSTVTDRYRGWSPRPPRTFVYQLPASCPCPWAAARDRLRSAATAARSRGGGPASASGFRPPSLRAPLLPHPRHSATCLFPAQAAPESLGGVARTPVARRPHGGHAHVNPGQANLKVLASKGNELQLKDWRLARPGTRTCARQIAAGLTQRGGYGRGAREGATVGGLPPVRDWIRARPTGPSG